MDISSRDSISEYLNSQESGCGKNCTIEDSEITELGDALTSVLNVQGVPLPIPGCIQPSDCNEIHEAKFPTVSTQKLFNKCVTLPISRKSDLNGNDFSHNPVCPRSLSLPTPLKLVSAMKGGREKEGITPLEKLTVKWAPDVYEPPATTVSHTVKSHNQPQRSSSRSNNKKHGKHKHKGKSSRGNNNSDKKQYRKYTSNSDSQRPISQVSSDNHRLQHLDAFEQSAGELVNFGVTGQDSSNCGSSFFKTSLTKMHISVAEAT